MPSADPVHLARVRVMRAGRAATPPEEKIAARRALAEAKLERAINEALEAAPPLTDAQRTRLATILSGGDA